MRAIAWACFCSESSLLRWLWRKQMSVQISRSKRAISATLRNFVPRGPEHPVHQEPPEIRVGPVPVLVQSSETKAAPAVLALGGPGKGLRFFDHAGYSGFDNR